MSFPCYAKRKDSSSEWLGEIPEHWGYVNLRWISRIYSGGTPDKLNLDYWTDGTVPWLNSGAVNQGLITSPSAFITQEAYENSSARWVPAGALVMALAGQGKTKGMVAEMSIPSTCNQSMAAIVPTGEVAARFLFWWLTSNYENIRNMAGGDLRDGLNLELLGSIPCPLISTEEQTAIAIVLDRETRKIDALIEEQRRLIELLNEKRQAVISQAVTKGLNPDAPMKNSDIEWLGRVPGHWELKKISNVATVVRGASPRPAGDSRYFNGNFIPWITVGEITKDDAMYLTSTETMLTQEGAECSRVMERGTLVLTNSGATLGVPKILAITGCANDGVLAFLQLPEDSSKEFLYYYLSSLTENLRERTKQGSGQPNLNTDIVKTLALPWPPPKEQNEIANKLTAMVSKFEKLVSEAEAVIKLLQERRTALISAAVTGKIDVRGQVAKPVAALKPYETGFARQLLAAEILHRFYAQPTMGRVKLQKLIHLCEHVAEIDEIHGDYQRKAAGPFDNTTMFGIAGGLSRQKWFSQVKEGGRTVYRPLEKAGDHQKYLARWANKMPAINKVLQLLGTARTQQCEIVSTLHAAWNDLLIEGKSPTDVEIIYEASDASRWHANKEKIDSSKWPKALKWMRDNGLAPTGYGSHTKRADSTPVTKAKPAKARKRQHEPA